MIPYDIISAQHQFLSADVDTAVLTSAQYVSTDLIPLFMSKFSFLPVVEIIVFFQTFGLSRTDMFNTERLLRHQV